MNADKTLKNIPLYTDEVDYQLVTMPSKGIVLAASILAEIAEPFGTVILDKDETTLIIPAEMVEQFQDRLEGLETSNPFRLITFDEELPFELTGFMALVATLLAEADVSIIPIAAFSRDHILVPADQFDKAWDTLSTYQQQ